MARRSATAPTSGLQKALELKLFQDQKDTIKLTSLVSTVVDKDTQEKIDIVKQRLIRNYGYDEESATDVLNFVASIFARGDVKQQRTSLEKGFCEARGPHSGLYSSDASV